MLPDYVASSFALVWYIKCVNLQLHFKAPNLTYIPSEQKNGSKKDEIWDGLDNVTKTPQL